MLHGEHESEEFERVHPSKYVPVLQDGSAFIYGNTFIMLAHLCSRYKKEGERVLPREYKSELSREFSSFEDNIKRSVKLLRRMLIAKRLAKKLHKDAPSENEIITKKADFFNIVVPTLNQKLKGKKFFVGNQLTMIDLVAFVELETVLVLLQEYPDEETRSISNFKYLSEWMDGIRGLPDFHEVHYDFT
jgi:glutathione S-transferase